MNFENGILWKKKTGIYMIEHLSTGKRYIGSSGRCLYTRYHQQTSDLTYSRHGNSYLQNAWNKYGADSFTFWVIEEHEPAYCSGMEHWWIQSAVPEYNLNTNTVTRLGAKVSEETLTRMRGRKVSLETREKLRKARGLQTLSPEQLRQNADAIAAKFNTPIVCSNGKIYKSLREAEADLTIPLPSISRILRGYTQFINTRHGLNFWYLNGESNSANIKYRKKDK